MVIKLMRVQQDVVDAIGSHSLSDPLQLFKAIVRALVQVCANACFAERRFCLCGMQTLQRRDGFQHFDAYVCLDPFSTAKSFCR